MLEWKLSTQGVHSIVADELERMRALVAQAIAEARRDGAAHNGLRLSEVHLVLYGDQDEAEARRLFEQASRDTGAEGARLVIERAGSRYICWNCCGLRFESSDGLCPNCGEVAMRVPDEIAFALRRAVPS